MARATQAMQESKRPSLQIPRDDAQHRLQSRIEQGKQLLQVKIISQGDLDNAKAEYTKWSDYNKTLLRNIIDTEKFVRLYTPSFGVSSLGYVSLQYEVEQFCDRLKDRITRLESIMGQLELIPESTSVAVSTKQNTAAGNGNRIFIVHGHDEEAKQSVARCIDKLGYEPVILHEQPNRGQTVIEKFEEFADVGFAVVLLTPDDVGASKKAPDNLLNRARQNVIFELGYLIGKLGRHRVCALHRSDLELPSDYSGILWVNMDSEGAWRFALVREMKAVGLEVDSNRLL